MQEAGHKVSFSIEEQVYARPLAGLIEEELSHSEPEDYDLVVFDQTGNGRFADKVKEKTPVIGDSEIADVLEHDRLEGIRFMERCGIKVPPYEHFTDITLALRFLRRTKKTYVFKPCGEDADTSSTYVSKSWEDLERYIDILWRSAPVKEFILQEVVKGTEVSTEMWMNERGYYFLNHTIECKKLMNDDLGPATGCAGNVVFPIERENPIFIHGLKKAYKELRDLGYVGMIDLNAIVTEGELYGLEWTPRFGYEGTANVTKLLPMDFAEFLHAVASGKTLPDLSSRHGFCASLRVAVPPYPNDGLPHKFYHAGIPIEGMTRKTLENFFTMDVRLNATNEDMFETAGINGWIGAALGCGETIGMAFDQVCGVIDSIRVPNLMYRTDIRGIVARRYNELKANGWLKPQVGS